MATSLSFRLSCAFASVPISCSLTHYFLNQKSRDLWFQQTMVNTAKLGAWFEHPLQGWSPFRKAGLSVVWADKVHWSCHSICSNSPRFLTIASKSYRICRSIISMYFGRASTQRKSPSPVLCGKPSFEVFFETPSVQDSQRKGVFEVCCQHSSAFFPFTLVCSALDDRTSMGKGRICNN
jgi:hypothetical protein